MNRISSYLLFLFFTFFILACGDKGNNTHQTGDEKASASAKTSQSKVNGLPVVPNELMQQLIDSSDYVDYLFYEMEFSMSMDNKQGIMYSIASIGEKAAEMNAACKPIGRIFFQIKGRNAAEADMYFSKGCT